MTKLRENPDTARVGLPWTTEEHQQLLTEVETDLTLEQIAQQHQRTPRAIHQRLLWETWNQVHRAQIPIDEACERLCIFREDFEAYEKERIQKEDRKKQPKNLKTPKTPKTPKDLNVDETNPSNNLSVLTDIQRSLALIAQQLEKMTQICDTLKNRSE
jgi:hypothetical protein